MKSLSNVLLSLPLRRYSLLPIVWKRIVGENITKFAQVIYYKDGVLFVGVPSGTHAAELSTHADEIIEKLSEELDTPISEIRFKVYSFNIRFEKDLNLDDLTEEDKRYINSIVSNIRYPEIRESIFRIIGYHILRKRKGI